MTPLTQIDDLTFTLFIEHGEIERKIKEVAQQIIREEQSNSPVFLVIMTGAFMFAADLLRLISFPCEVRFVRVKSYSGIHSSGNVKLEEDYMENLRDRHVIIVEDIVDTGLTIQKLKEYLFSQQVRSVKICTLLSKPNAHQYPIEVSYCCFEIPNLFVVGYGLDYNDAGRQLPDIWQLHQS